MTRVVEWFHEMWVSLLTLYTDTFHSLIYTEEAGSNDGETRRVTGRVNLVRAAGGEALVPYSSLDTEPIISLSRQYVLKHGDMTGATAPVYWLRIVQTVHTSYTCGCLLGQGFRLGQWCRWKERCGQEWVRQPKVIASTMANTKPKFNNQVQLDMNLLFL